MFKVRNLTIAYAFHLVMILMFAWLIFKVQAAKEKAYASKVQQKMVGVASTFSVLPGRHTLEDLAKDRLLPAEQTEGAYRIAQEQLQQVLDANGISDFELSVIQYAPQQQTLFRLVSSNPIYALGETFHDLNGKVLERFHIGHAERLSFDNGIQKIHVFEPLKDMHGGTMGVVRIESSDLTERSSIQSTMIWYWLLIIVYAIAAAIITPQMLKRMGDRKLERSQEAVDEELRQKNKELKMLSLVAKKSKNLTLITDKDGTILWVNKTYEHMNNYSAQELNSFVGRYLPEVSKNEDIRNIIRNVTRFKESVDYDSVSIDPHGEEFHALTTVTPILDHMGEVTNLLFVETDISRLKRIEQENETFKIFAEKCNAPRIHMSRDGEVRYNNTPAMALLNKWRMPGSEELKEEIRIMLQGISDSGHMQLMEMDIHGRYLKVSIHPDKEDGSLHILGEVIHIEEYSSAPNPSSNHNARKAG